jgi:hypothetical protein
VEKSPAKSKMSIFSIPNMLNLGQNSPISCDQSFDQPSSQKKDSDNLFTI